MNSTVAKCELSKERVVLPDTDSVECKCDIRPQTRTVMSEGRYARFAALVASRLKIRNIVIRYALAECLGTFLLVVSETITRKYNNYN